MPKEVLKGLQPDFPDSVGYKRSRDAKMAKIFGEFGGRLTRQAIPDLRVMISTSVCPGAKTNVLQDIWEAYHLVPTSAEWADFAERNQLDLSEIVEVMEAIWESEDEDERLTR